jgi:hypothetical protein
MEAFIDLVLEKVNPMAERFGPLSVASLVGRPG